jgi:hypothetical protein
MYDIVDEVVSFIDGFVKFFYFMFIVLACLLAGLNTLNIMGFFEEMRIEAWKNNKMLLAFVLMPYGSYTIMLLLFSAVLIKLGI